MFVSAAREKEDKCTWIWASFLRGLFFLQSFLPPGNPFDILGGKMSALLSAKSMPLGRSLNLEVVVCNQSPSIPSKTPTFLRLWNLKPVGWRATTFPNHRMMRTDKPHLSNCSLHEAKLLEMQSKLLKALSAVVAGFPQRSLLSSLRTELGPPQPDRSVWKLVKWNKTPFQLYAFNVHKYPLGMTVSVTTSHKAKNIWWRACTQTTTINHSRLVNVLWIPWCSRFCYVNRRDKRK